MNENIMWFDWSKYIELQANQIQDRLVNTAWRLYLQVENLVKDDYTPKILPWYFEDSLKQIFSKFKDKLEMVVCINADDIIKDTRIWEDNLPLWDFLEHRLLVLERNYWTKPAIVITNIDIWNMFDLVLTFERRFQKKQYRVFEKYKISWYPYNLHAMLSEEWFWSDDHIPFTKNLILVTGIWKSSGKFSTCLWQIYMDNGIWVRAWYAKFQTFPIRNLSINHPINLAYQSINIGLDSQNIIDECHKKSYNQDAVTLKKDLESFKVLQDFAKSTVNHKNYMIKYNSSIDMAINCTWMCIADEDLIIKSCLNVISQQKEMYQSKWDEDLVQKISEIYDLAIQWKK